MSLPAHSSEDPHPPEPGFRSVFVATGLAMGLYLALIFILSPDPVLHHHKDSSYPKSHEQPQKAH